jgi:hypothetical protein
MPFRSVCETIRDYAFASSNLPLIVSLEVHTSPGQQDIMVELMKQYWGGMLVDLPPDMSGSMEDLKLPTLKQLENKILVKVKRGTSKPAASSAKPSPLQAPALSANTGPQVSASSAKPSPSQAVASSSNTSTLQAPAQLSKPNSRELTLSDTTGSDNSDNPDGPPAPKPKVIEALSQLGVYFGGYSYKGLHTPGMRPIPSLRMLIAD